MPIVAAVAITACIALIPIALLFVAWRTAAGVADIYLGWWIGACVERDRARNEIAELRARLAAAAEANARFASENALLRQSEGLAASALVALKGVMESAIDDLIDAHDEIFADPYGSGDDDDSDRVPGIFPSRN